MRAITNNEQQLINQALEILEVTTKYNQTTFDSASRSESYFKLRFAGIEREEFHVAYLTNAHKLIKCEIASTGTINQASIYPREIVKSALRNNAAAVIFSHNHPSGESEPSQADKAITERLQTALELVDVRVLDHLVIGSEAVTSFASRGLI